MKTQIHPTVFDTEVECTGCGNKFTTRSTRKQIVVSICSNCHPHFTGTRRLVDTEGRVDRYKRRFGEAGVSTGRKRRSSKKTK